MNRAAKKKSQKREKCKLAALQAKHTLCFDKRLFHLLSGIFVFSREERTQKEEARTAKANKAQRQQTEFLVVLVGFFVHGLVLC